MFATGKVMPGNSDVLQVSYGDDSGLFAEFYVNDYTILDKIRTEEEGRPIYKRLEYVKIWAAGDKTKTWDRPVKKAFDGGEPPDHLRFAGAWQKFMNKEKADAGEGTPISHWPVITRGDVESFKSIGIHTIEQLASLGEHNFTFLGARTMRDKAKAWLESAKGNAEAVKLAKDKEELQDQITALQNQINGFIQVGAMPKQEASAPPAPKKRGPKPKVKNEQNISGVDTSGS